MRQEARVLEFIHQIGDRDRLTREFHSWPPFLGTKVRCLLLLWHFLNFIEFLVSALLGTFRFGDIKLMLMLFATHMRNHETA